MESLTKPGRHGDGHGLYLYVKPSGRKSWVQRLTINGRVHDIGLGGYPLVSLAEARQVAFENRRLARAGGDPLTLNRIAAVPTFEEAARTVFEIYRPGWTNAKHAAQWFTSLHQHVFPDLGKRPVSTITTSDIMAVLLTIWHDKYETASRVRQRISTVMKWAIAEGYRVDNPAGDALGAVLPRRPSHVKKHHPALPYTEVAGAVDAVRGSDAGLAVKLAFEFLVLTAARSGEVRFATWEEIDMDKVMWTIPAERMKAKRRHRVALSLRALTILEEARALDDGSGLVFPGAKRGRPIGISAMLKTIRGLGFDTVPHGFRSSFRDWAAECTNTRHAVMEAALAHTVRNKTEASYFRTDLFERRRTLMDQWSEFLSRVSVAQIVQKVQHQRDRA